jgi:hypothetical protein
MAGPKDGEHDSNQRGQAKDALPEPADFDPEGLLCGADVTNAEDRRSRALEPSGRSRSRYAESRGDPGVSRLADEVAQPMVVSSLSSSACHDLRLDDGNPLVKLREFGARL